MSCVHGFPEETVILLIYIETRDNVSITGVYRDADCSFG